MAVMIRFTYAALPTRNVYADEGDIMLKVINEDDAEYGGRLEDVRSDVS